MIKILVLTSKIGLPM